MRIARLAGIPWSALRADVALPAIARVLEGAAAEREVDRALRSNRGLSGDERSAAVEAIFGVALWRRRLAWRDGLFEPQDEGSQLLGQLVEAQPGDTVLDLCAGEFLQLLPHRDGTDGFFAAAWDRT